MRTILFKVILVLGLVLGFQTNARAQLFYIPDTAFRSYLNQNFASCMVGDSIDPTCPAVLNARNINLIGKGISDLTGFEVFVNDTSLNCDYNSLTSLPSLPSNLIILKCGFNQLTSLPSLPSTLKDLDCHKNQITSLPTLPNNLIFFNCYGNQITNLPSLPNSLYQVICDQNLITSLPTLPSNLYELYCYSNQLTNLPTLPYTLRKLYCSGNQFTSLPTLPPYLRDLSCYGNQLNALPILPNHLNLLWCQGNLLTSLPIFPNNLKTLDCSNNPITCLPDLNNVVNLKFTNTLISCIPSYGVVQQSTPSITSVPICDLFNNNGCEVFWNIEGKSFVDLDANCIFGINDRGFAKQKLNLYKNGFLDKITYSASTGYYSFNTTAFGQYKIELDTSGIPLGVNCPSAGFYLDTISASDSLKRDRDFALKCKGIDLAATSIYTEDIRPARVIEVSVHAGDLPNSYGLSCGAGVCGTVSITISGDCSYYSSPNYALTPTSIVGNVLTYNVADFGALSYDSIFDFNLLVDTTASLGSQICIAVSVFTKCVQEINYTNNQLTQCFTVVGSFDPNDKAVSPTTTMDLSGNRWLTYTIRFQNTGTASAEHILITDTISNDLILSSFTYLSSSHDPIVDLKLDIKRVVKFQFPFINLPDSNTNEPASHGYVQFKIKAKDSLIIGNAIENSANIYFDFNAPVITNTTSNTIINCNIPTTNLSSTLCNGDVYSLNGMEYYSTGIYKQNLLTAFGCDSTVRLNLTVNKSTITRSNDTLQATTLNAISYQWINCTTGTSIVGANAQTYNPTQSGNYAVVVDFGNCVDTSNCYYFSPVGINEINASNIIIQPNPFNNELKITLDKNYNGVLEVYNTLGEIITAEKLQIRNVTLNTSNWNAGVYILKVATNAGVVVNKVVKR